MGHLGDFITRQCRIAERGAEMCRKLGAGRHVGPTRRWLFAISRTASRGSHQLGHRLMVGSATSGLAGEADAPSAANLRAAASLQRRRACLLLPAVGGAVVGSRGTASPCCRPTPDVAITTAMCGALPRSAHTHSNRIRRRRLLFSGHVYALGAISASSARDPRVGWRALDVNAATATRAFFALEHGAQATRRRACVAVAVCALRASI